MVETTMRFFLSAIIIFTVIALSIICVKLLALLEKHYKLFYKQNSRFIISMTTLLVFSSIVRVLNVVWRQKIQG